MVKIKNAYISKFYIYSISRFRYQPMRLAESYRLIPISHFVKKSSYPFFPLDGRTFLRYSQRDKRAIPRPLVMNSPTRRDPNFERSRSLPKALHHLYPTSSRKGGVGNSPAASVGTIKALLLLDHLAVEPRPTTPLVTDGSTERRTVGVSRREGIEGSRDPASHTGQF